MRLDRLMRLTIVTALLLLALSTIASATHISVDTTEFSMTWAPATIEVAGNSLRCNVTMEGSFSGRTFDKRAGPTARVTAASLGSCIGGTATILSETLPWTVAYQSFSGTLPNIRGITLNLIGAAAQVNLAGIVCLATTEAAQPARGIVEISEGSATGFTSDERAGITTRGGFFCSLAGASHLLRDPSPLPTPIPIHLI